MAGLVDGTINGYLDVRGAILRVGQLDVVGLGRHMATSVLKQDSVLIWDDQGTDLNNPRSLRGEATHQRLMGTTCSRNSGGHIARDQTPKRVDDGFRSVRLDLRWVCQIHTYDAESTYDGLGTGSSSLRVRARSRSNTAERRCIRRRP